MQDKAKDRIRKLIALQKGAGTEEEAKAAAGHVARLLARHGLTEEDIADPDEPREDVSEDFVVVARFKRLPKWLEVLSAELAWMCGCFMFRSRDRSARETKLECMGRPSDIATLRTLLPSFADTIRRIGASHPRQGRSEYCLGLACAIASRMRQSRNAVMCQIRKNSDQAVAVIDWHERSRQAALARRAITKAPPLTKVGPSFGRGARDGQDVQIPGDQAAMVGQKALGPSQ